MDDTIKELERSELYHKIHHQWENNPTLRSNIIDRVGSDSKMLMVVYDLGSIESSYDSRFNLALAILLKRDFSDWISGMEAYESDISLTDAKVMEALGCSVLSLNEECIGRIEKPTLFYMPDASYWPIGDLLKANWDPSCLNQMILLTDSLKNVMEDWRSSDTDNWTDLSRTDYLISRERGHYIEAIRKQHTLEFAMSREDDDSQNPFNILSCHFFHLDPKLDMASLLPDIDWALFYESSADIEEKSNFFTRWVKCYSESEISHEEDELDEVERLTEEMDKTIKILEGLKLYHEIHDQWKENDKFRSNIIDGVLSGSDSKMLMVIYALGSIESSYESRFQLALAILLKRDFSDWISGIEAYDPDISLTDTKVMEALGCKVLSVNEECRRRIEKPTLFYMPYALNEHIGNLLEANWSPSCLNKMILLTFGFESTMEFWRYLDDNPTDPSSWEPISHQSKTYYLTRERVDYIEAIQKHTLEFPFTREEDDECRNPLQKFSFHFFHLDPQLDMASLLPDGPAREKRLKIKRREERRWDWKMLFQS